MRRKKEKREGKPRLLIATDNFLPRWDGIARFLSEIIPKLTDEYDVTVIAPKFGVYKPEGFRLVSVPLSKMGIGDYTSAKVKRGVVKKEVREADIVFSQTIGPIGFLSVYYAKKLKVPVASFVHSVEWELVPLATSNSLAKKFFFPFTKLFAKWIYNKSNLLVVPSETTGETMSWNGIKTKKAVANLGVDCEVFKPYKDLNEKEQREVDRVREELGLKDCFVIGNHGRIAREKDLMTLLRAYKWIHKKHEDARLLILGEGVPELKEKLKAVPGVILPGAKNNVNVYLNVMDVYVTSSLTETTSLTTLESMASGLPVVCTPVGFIKDYVKDTVNGFLFPVRDAYSLSRTIELLKNQPSLRKSIGANARKSVLKEFTWERTVEKIKELLRGLRS